MIARRKRLREDLLHRLVTEEDGTFVQTTRWDIHPLEAVLGSDEIAQILLQTTVEAAREASETLLQSTSQAQIPNATGTGQGTGDDNHEEQQQQQRQQEQRQQQHQQSNHPQQRDRQNGTDDDRHNNERQDEEQKTLPPEMLRLLAADGSEFRVPREVGSLLAELIAKVKSLEDIVLNRQRHVASSTHSAEPRTGHNVQFESTYTVHGDETWNGLPHRQHHRQLGLVARLIYGA